MDYFLEKKSNQILKASKTVKTPNNGDVKSVTVGHLKRYFHLLKSITQSNIVTQEIETI